MEATPTVQYGRHIYGVLADERCLYGLNDVSKQPQKSALETGAKKIAEQQQPKSKWDHRLGEQRALT